MEYSVLMVVFWIVIVVLIARAKKAGAAKQRNRGGAAAPRAVPTRVYRRPPDPDDCDFGDINHEFSHQYDRRIQQLEGYLKAGLIDQKEYREMLARYRRQMRDID